jgi:hypothetical protein
VYFMGDKGGRCVRLTTLPPSCAVVMKSGNINFLEHSGPLQDSNGTAAALICTYKVRTIMTGRGGFIVRANKAYVSGPLTRTGPFQGPGRGPSNALTLSYFLKNLEKEDILATISYVLQSCVWQLINKNNLLFYCILWCMWYLSAFYNFIIRCDFSNFKLIIPFVPNFVFVICILFLKVDPQNFISFRTHKTWIRP